MKARWLILVVSVGLGIIGCLHPKFRPQSADDAETKEAQEKTIGDVSTVANVEPTPVLGVGLVVNLNGSGGGMPPASTYRTMLENDLKARGVRDINSMLGSPNNTMVIVTTEIPAGSRKGDPMDAIITLPDQSRCTSLKGGYLVQCELYNYEMTKRVNPNAQNANRALKGYKLALAEGRVLVGVEGKAKVRAQAPATASGEDDDDSPKFGRVWGGCTCLESLPIALNLNNDQQQARIAARVAERINETFPGARIGNDQLASARNRSLIVLGVPSQYRHNLPHYLRVVRAIPLEHVPPKDGAYRRKLGEQLLDPAHTLVAAIRLEALGEDSVPVLKSALKEPSFLVRFAAAEALAYLRKPACAEELARLAKEQPAIRAHCLTALASLDESICRRKLEELMGEKDAALRYGAFHGLRVMDERDSEVVGAKLNNSYWLHQVAKDSPPTVHYLTSRRPEIVLFGDMQTLIPPFRFAVGEEFTITANRDDTVCTISRFSKSVAHRQCSMNLADVLQNLSELGGMYTDAVDLLQKADQQGR
ncbi:MAG TPA: flagellar basal body P-ring protein FlgI, partial [Gemmataceae bacterium]|nr:flagellar basal body P-ring protein FlgI [Gemmataceae bacterium]